MPPHNRYSDILSGLGYGPESRYNPAPPPQGLLTTIGRGLDWPRRKLWETLGLGSTGWDLLKKLGVYDRPKRLDPVDFLAFGAELVGDPLTYLGIGGLNRAGKVAKTGAQALASKRALSHVPSSVSKLIPEVIGGATKAADNAITGAARSAPWSTTLAGQAAAGHRGLVNMHVPFTGVNRTLVRGPQKLWSGLDRLGAGLARTGPAQSILKRFHSPEWEQAAGSGLWRRMDMDKLAAKHVGDLVRRGVSGLGEDTARQVRKATKGVDDLDVIRQVEEGVDTPGANQMRELTDRLLAAEEPTLGTMPLQMDREYLARIGKKELLKSLAKHKHRGAAEFPHAIPRTHRGAFAESAAEVGKKHGVDKPFETDPALIIKARADRSGRALGDLVEQRARMEPFTLQDEIEGVTKTGLDMAKELGVDRQFSRAIQDDLANVHVRPEHADEIFSIKQKAFDPTQLGSVERGWRKLNAIYRFGAIGIYPAYYARNAYSNFFMNSMAGVPPSAYLKAWRSLSKYKVTGVADDVIKEARAARGIGAGPIREIAQDIGKLRGAGQKVNRAAEWTGSSVEDFFRLAHYIGKKDQGLDTLSAAASVRRYLFNYDELTPFEQRTMKGAFFFYTWTRNVLPFLAREVVENTGRIATMSRAATMPSIERKDVPHWLQETAAIPWGQDKEGRDTYLTGIGVPIEEVSKFDPSSAPPGFANKVGRIFEKFAGQLVPLAKAPLELIAGEDFFLDKPIDETDKTGPLTEGLVPDWKQYETSSGRTEYRANPDALWALRNLPFSRLGNIAGKWADERKSSGGKAWPTLTGLRIQSVDPDTELSRNEIRAITDQLNREMAAGNAKRFQSFFPVGEEGDRVRELLKLLREKKNQLRQSYQR